MKRLAICALVSCLGVGSQAYGQSSMITTVAGNGTKGFSGDGGPATAASLDDPEHVLTDASRNLYISDVLNNRIRKVAPGGVITTIAGNGFKGFSGDGGPATSASLAVPGAVALDASGNLYIADNGNSRIRKVSTSGVITTVAGGGTQSFSTDGVPATSVALVNPICAVTDVSGNLFIADWGLSRILRVSTDGTISSVAGNGTLGFSGDGGPATSAALNAPEGVAVDAFGNLFIGDNNNNRIRKVSANGIITTLAGNGISGFSGDGGPATSASLSGPYDIAVDTAGNVYIDDNQNQRIRMVSTNGVITTVVGTGVAGYSGDGGPAAGAMLNFPGGLALDAAGDLFIADIANSRVREAVSLAPPAPTLSAAPASLSFSLAVGGSSSQTISLIGSAGVPWSASASANWITLTPASGTGPGAISILANTASLPAGTYTAVITILNPTALPAQETVTVNLAVTPPGLTAMPATLSFQVTQGSLAQTQMVQIGGTAGSAWQATATTSAGGAWLSVSPGAGQIPASLTALVSPGSLTAGTYQGSITIQAPAVMPSSVVVNVTLSVAAQNPASQIITTLSGSAWVYPSNITTALNAPLGNVPGVAVDSQGNVYVADWGNDRVFMVNASGGIQIAAGNGTSGFSGDGGPATSASLHLSPAEYDFASRSSGVAVDASGNLFIADLGNQRIRKVTPDGTITTAAGGGSPADGVGDGGPATSAALSFPRSIALDASGNLYIADGVRVRQVAASSGIITTVAGGGNPLNGPGDGGAATSANLGFPQGVAVDAAGNLFISDGDQIREVQAASGIIMTIGGNGTDGFSGDGGPAVSAQLSSPTGIAVDGFGNLMVADSGNNCIREVSANGIITTVAGNGTSLDFHGQEFA